MLIEKATYGQNTDNLVITGNNVEVLSELVTKYAGGIKCIYIDPPYNNAEKYKHYSDNKSHDEWISDMKATLPLLFKLLTDDGSLWISIDDREVHYLKVLCDELFGRKSFVTTIVWEHRKTRENRKVFSNNHEYLLVYARDPKKFHKSRNKLPTDKIPKSYKNPDNDPRGLWQSVSLTTQDGHAVESQFYEIVAPGGKVHRPSKGRCWAHNKETMEEEIAKGNVYFGKNGNGVPRKKQFLSETILGLTPNTLWKSGEVGTTDDSKKHLLELLPEVTVFDTPKPESLIERVLQISTNVGDLVLDAYSGSGTTAAVCMKMNRGFITIDCSDMSIDYTLQRLQKVINGENGGISSTYRWEGGSGFKHFIHSSDE